ncbi:MAG: membrane integrity-associated transporter subunit PqiC [Steroidobacteraceae bacterium]|nr:membrane integrity-associated transporter subunit PqiC [Steroidobacteraceae bacterium]
MSRIGMLVFGSLALAGCGSLLETTIPAPQSYVLRLPVSIATSAATPAGSILVQRPEPGPGLDSWNIALLRSDRRFDFYAASHWAAPAPDLVESVLIDALRAGGGFTSVLDDSSPFAPRYNLRCGLRRFEADYTVGGVPTVFVSLECTVGRHRDRELLGSFVAEGSAVASEDRLNAIVAAFEAASTQAVGALERAAREAVARDPVPAQTN